MHSTGSAHPLCVRAPPYIGGYFLVFDVPKQADTPKSPVCFYRLPGSVRSPRGRPRPPLKDHKTPQVVHTAVRTTTEEHGA